MLVVDNQVFQNWAKTFSCRPEQYVLAQSEADVVEAVAAARKAGRRVRVVGSGHSPSDIACTTGTMININALNRVVKVDSDARQVTVEAGTTLQQLNELLDRLGWAMPNLGSISEQTIAGAISTGTHGTGIEFGALATAIVDLRLVTASGEVLALSRTSSPDVFLAALCSLGCLGVITQVTIQAVPAFQIRAEQAPISFADMIANFESLVRSADHVRFWWFPHTDNCIVWKGTRTSDPPQPSKINWLRDIFLGVHVYELSLYMSTLVPQLVPAINQRYFQRFFNKQLTTTDKSFKIFNFDCLFSQYVTEWAVEWSKAPEALSRLKKFIEDNPEVVAHSPVEIRFVKRDDIHLSMSSGYDTCFIGIIMYRPYGKDVTKEKYWAGYEKIMEDLGGRPHWAKAHRLGPQELRKLYPKFDSFCAIRAKLDPDNVFVNDYIDRHLVSGLKAKL
ncbi:D-arabinono-1,4-lactone oxidase [Polyrhizophydium stewartii]|uniref:D-arabinono-1,4-lactone oxidase n=1 Tax=Polyrhizophydium stewartii TaxID=2732419 RepID=A0ABR4N1Z1_9FUNG